MTAQPMIPQKMIDECMERLLPDEKDRADPWKRFEALTTHIMHGAGRKVIGKPTLPEKSK